VLSKLNFIRHVIKNKGILHFFKRYILQGLFKQLKFGPYHAVLRTIEICLPAEQKRRYTLPDYLQLEPTSRCNMNCRNCTRDTLSKFGDLRLDSFLYIARQFPFLREVKLQGLGEPLLNNSLFDMASFLKDKKVTTYIATNATLVTKETASDMVKYFDKIEISIDSSDRQLLKDIRGKDCMDDTLRGARLLRSSNGNSDMAINFVMERSNAGNLVAMIGLAKDLDINHINVVGLQNWVNTGSAYTKKRREIFQRSPETAANSGSNMKEIMRLAKSSNIYVDLSISDNQKKGCFWHKRGVYISWNGYVAPCCIRPNYEEFNFGNILETDIRNIWNSPKYINFRSALNAGKIPSLCKGCNYA